MDLLEFKEYLDTRHLEILKEIKQEKKELKRLKIELKIYEDLHFKIVDNINEE